MEGKTVKESSVTLSHVALPQDANRAGNVHGGVVMKHIDSAAAVAATRHARSDCVTASIDKLDFYSPVYIGNFITLKASINLVGRTSMEVGVRVEAEDLFTGEVNHTSSAYLTFVALDKDGRPKEVPPLILVSEDDKRRNRESLLRREIRLSENKRLKND
jgi:acyl-CoA hydrolase